jgi:hypothetical protein
MLVLREDINMSEKDISFSPWQNAYKSINNCDKKRKTTRKVMLATISNCSFPDNFRF